MKLRKVHFPSDSKIEWQIKGRTNNGHSSQNDDGFEYINTKIKAETKEEAIRLFEAKIEEFKQAKKAGGNTVYIQINISLQFKKGDSVKIIKKVSLLFEKYIREKINTIKTGRGWIESKKWLRLEGKTRLKDGSIRTKNVNSSDNDWY